MKRTLVPIGICLAIFLAASLGMAKNKGGVMTGTWDCQAHGGSQGDMAFTLYLQQNKETVDGSISSPIGGTQISSGTFKKNMLEIHLDTPQGNYILMANFKKGKLSGTWSNDNDKGVWEGTKQVAAAK
ncbi:MAG TPA: hypothetical protein VMO17_22420 [Terriglobia bacterium]|nr:hypothetical protein [Terriglobia bacterium]